MLVHTVIFYLRSDLTPAQREEFRREGLESLRAIPALASYHVGQPAAVPPRPVVDASYDFAITGIFADLAAHHGYQVHPLHTAFVARFKGYWQRLQIYDAE